MNKARLEAFSDGVLAIILTIMVLDLRVPHDPGFDALQPLIPVFMSYILSFVFIGIYWNNHHHLMSLVQKITGPILWANLHLLFWLSLIPFTTGWMGEHYFAPAPVALYGVVLLGAALAYTILSHLLMKVQGKKSLLATAIGKDAKGIISIILYVAAIPLAFYRDWMSLVIYSVVAVTWLVPDSRIENVIEKRAKN